MVTVRMKRSIVGVMPETKRTVCEKAKEEQQSAMMKFMLITFAPERKRAAVFQLHLTAEEKA